MLRQVYDQKIKIRKELTDDLNMGSLAEHISEKLKASVVKDAQSASLVITTEEPCSYETLNPILADWAKCAILETSLLYNIMPLKNNTVLVRL